MDLIFGKYEIQHRLAVGGMGEVFSASQKGVPGFERPVILKSLLPDLALQEGFIEQFLDEARVAATLNHPNVVSIYEVGQWNGTYYLAMEYIRGRNLSQLMRRAVEAQLDLPQLVAARIIRDAALGLDHAHRAADASGAPLHIVHRDISPQNIMVRDDGLTKVVDFGIARATNRATRTATGALKGKLAYMAPEQVLDQNVGPAVDQFALGIVLWEMLAHRRLFKADRDIDIARKVLEEPIVPPSSLRPISPALEAVVMRMLERDVSRRFPSCAEVAQALDTVLTAESSAASSPKDFMRQLGTDDLVLNPRPSAGSEKNFVIALKQAPPPLGPAPTRTGASPPQPPTRRRSGLLAVVGVVGLAVVLGAGVMLAFDGPTSTTAPEVGVSPVVAVSAPAPAPPVVRPTVAPPVEPDAPVATGRLRISSTPAQASVRLDGRLLGPTPQEVEVTAGQPHYLAIERSGYQRVEEELTVDGGEAREVTIRLKALEGRPKATPPPVATNAAPGFLSVETEPWTKVSVDGEPLGSTPLFKKRLAAGRHELVFINEGANVSEKRVVTIEPGETKKLMLSFKK